MLVSRPSPISSEQKNESGNVKLKQVYLTAVEPEELARFYQALGMEIRFADSGKWVQFVSEKTAFCIAGPTESASRPSGDAVLVFEVEDLEAKLEVARSAGADVFGDIRDMGSHGRAAQLRDPQGNTIQLFQAARA